MVGFCFSVDFEGHYGDNKVPYSVDLNVIKKLGAISKKHGIKITYAISGSILFSSPEQYAERLNKMSNSQNFLELNLNLNKLLYAPKEVEKIVSSDAEISSHSFSHLSFQKCSKFFAEADLKESSRAFRKFGVKPKSFVFPRNEVNHLSILPSHGYTHFASFPTPKNFLLNYGAFPSLDFNLPRKVGKLIEVPRTAYFYRTKPTEIFRLMLALKLSKEKYFHLWAHPWSLQTKAHFSAIESIFLKAKKYGFASSNISEFSV